MRLIADAYTADFWAMIAGGFRPTGFRWPYKRRPRYGVLS